jgi:hypothetical protein
VSGNQVRGAKVGINVDGAGDREWPLTIFDNQVWDILAPSIFAECADTILTSWMNISPISIVDRRDDFVPTTAQLSDECQFWSEVKRQDPR